MRKNSACLSSHHEMYSKTIVYETFVIIQKRNIFLVPLVYTIQYSNNVILYLISTLSGG